MPSIAASGIGTGALRPVIPLEIERKFLVTGESWRGQGRIRRIRQGYLTSPSHVRLRVRRQDEGAQIAIKTLVSDSPALTRMELEYDIPAAHADHLLAHACERPPLEKLRHEIFAAGRLWVVDEFLGENAGLILAEVELERPDAPVALPSWVGREVTQDQRFHNSYLYTRPYGMWEPADAV